MIPLIWLVFLVQLVIYLVNTIGAKTINDLLWQLSARLPLPSSREKQEQTRLRREVVRLKREMNAVSAQDDFARWAKRRREHDKVLAAHDETAKRVDASRARFDTTATALRWVSTSGLRFVLQFWHAKTPIFELPKGWFPWYVEFVLGFPRCPYGGVSINVWSTVCGTVIALVGSLVSWAFTSLVGANENSTAAPKRPVAVAEGPEKKKS